MFTSITIKIQIQKFYGVAEAYMVFENFELPSGTHIVWQTEIDLMNVQIDDLGKLLDLHIGNKQNEALLTFKEKEARACHLRFNKNDFSHQGSPIKSNVLKKFKSANWQRFIGLEYFNTGTRIPAPLESIYKGETKRFYE